MYVLPLVYCRDFHNSTTVVNQEHTVVTSCITTYMYVSITYTILRRESQLYFYHADHL